MKFYFNASKLCSSCTLEKQPLPEIVARNFLVFLIWKKNYFMKLLFS